MSRIFRVDRVGAVLLVALLVGGSGAYAADPSAGPSVSPSASPSDAPDPDDAASLAEAEALWEGDPASRDARLATIGAELELAVAEQSGLAQALGGRDPAGVALAEAWAPLISTVTEDLGTDQPPVAIASLVAVAADEPSIGEGMFGGSLTVALGAEGVVNASNDLPGGTPVRGPFNGSPELTLDMSPERASLTFDGTNENNGVKTALKTRLTVAPCPSADGTFEATATIDVSVTKGSIGQDGSLNVKVTGHVDDDARLTSSDLEYRMQWSKFGGARGEYVDVGGTLGGGTLRRTGDAATSGLASEAASTVFLYAFMIKGHLEDAAKKGWESGRCVRLDVTPSAGPKDLEPSQEVSLLAAPRSKIDGAPAGGSVKAVLTAGGATVSPSATKVRADATFSYVAPDQADKSGTVAFEARSKRGVGKATLEFTTAGGTYEAMDIPGGRTWKSACIPSLDKPFTIRWEAPDGSGQFKVIPDSESSGRISWRDHTELGGSTIDNTAKGRYTIVVYSKKADGSPSELDIVYSGKGKARLCVGPTCQNSKIAIDEAFIPIRPRTGRCPAAPPKAKP